MARPFFIILFPKDYVRQGLEADWGGHRFGNQDVKPG